MFSSPVSIWLSLRSREPLLSRALELRPTSMMFCRVTYGRRTLIDRIWPAEVQGRAGYLPDELTEAHDDAKLVRIDAESKRLPGDDRAGDDRHEEQQRAGNAATVHDLLYLVLARFSISSRSVGWPPPDP